MIWSDDTDPAKVSEILGLSPSAMTQKGTVSRSGRVQDKHAWAVHVLPLENTADDQTGTRSLKELLRRVQPSAARFSFLPGDCEVRIWWSAESESVYGGFVLPIDLLRQVAALGADIHGTVYLETPSMSDQ